MVQIIYVPDDDDAASGFRTDDKDSSRRRGKIQSKKTERTGQQRNTSSIIINDINSGGERKGNQAQQAPSALYLLTRVSMLVQVLVVARPWPQGSPHSSSD